MAEAERPREIPVGIPFSQSPPSPIAANVVVVNKLGQTFILDFGFLDPLFLATHPPQVGETALAAHVGRIVIAEDLAGRLRDEISRILGEV
jgi:hypothetical protein